MTLYGGVFAVQGLVLHQKVLIRAGTPDGQTLLSMPFGNYHFGPANLARAEGFSRGDR